MAASDPRRKQANRKYYNELDDEPTWKLKDKVKILRIFHSIEDKRIQTRTRPTDKVTKQGPKVSVLTADKNWSGEICGTR